MGVEAICNAVNFSPAQDRGRLALRPRSPEEIEPYIIISNGLVGHSAYGTTVTDSSIAGARENSVMLTRSIKGSEGTTRRNFDTGASVVKLSGGLALCMTIYDSRLSKEPKLGTCVGIKHDGLLADTDAKRTLISEGIFFLLNNPPEATVNTEGFLDYFQLLSIHVSRMPAVQTRFKPARGHTTKRLSIV